MRHYLIPMTMAALSLSACASSSSLKDEIVVLQHRSAQLGDGIDRSTSDIGTRADDIYVRLAYRPLLSWGQSITARPADQRMIRFQQTSREGRIERRRINCHWPLGDGEWYVEINSGNPTRGSVLIERFDLHPEADGLSLSTPLAIDVETRVHWHFDPCVGGGVGGNVFIDAEKRLNANARLTFLPMTEEGALPYTLDLTAPQEVNITAQVHLGPIGTLGVPLEVGSMARRLGQGSVNLGFRQDGMISPMPDGAAYAYSLHTRNPRFTSSPTGLELASDLEVEIVPVVTPPGSVQ